MLAHMTYSGSVCSGASGSIPLTAGLTSVILTIVFITVSSQQVLTSLNKVGVLGSKSQQHESDGIIKIYEVISKLEKLHDIVAATGREQTLVKADGCFRLTFFINH